MAVSVTIDLLRVVATSDEVCRLQSGHSTHEPACVLVAKLVAHTQDEDHIGSIIRSCLPANYEGNTLSEVPTMIKGALAKGFDANKSAGAAAKKTVADLLVDIFDQSGAEVFRDDDGKQYGSLPTPDGCAITYPLRSPHVRDFMHNHYHSNLGRSASPSALDQAINTLVARAKFVSLSCEVALRVGGTRHGFAETYSDGDAGDDGDAASAPSGGTACVVHDLGRSDGQVVEIDAVGYRLTSVPPVRMVRSTGMRALPLPKPGPHDNAGIKAFRELFSLDEDNAKLCVAFMVGALRPSGPYACLSVEGQPGAGKSMLCEAIKAILDPAEAMRASLPNKAQDLMIAASNHWVPVFDNLSSIQNLMSDALCSVSTGAGFQARELFTDGGLFIIKLSRPFILNGIGDFVRRSDLVDRAIPIELTAPGPDGRKTERSMRARLDEITPWLLHDLYRAVQAAIGNLPSTPEVTSVRMADMAQWVTAAEPALGWEDGLFVELLAGTQNNAKGALADSPITRALLMVLNGTSEHAPFVGKMSELFEKLSEKFERHDRFAPKTAAHLSSELQRMRDGLSQRGVMVELLKRNKSGRMVRAWLTSDAVQPESSANRYAPF